MSIPARLPWHAQAWSTLARSLDAGRLHHALLLEGPSGLGKLRFAQRAAAAMLCEAPGAAERRPCEACRSCLLVAAGSHPDRLLLTPDEDRAIIGVDRVRERIAELALTPHYATRRVILVTPADALNRHAANTLLKTLEEPPGGALFLLVTARPSALPATIRSRCSRLAFRAPPQAAGRRWLEDEAGMDPEHAGDALAWSAGAPLAAEDAISTGALAASRDMAGEVAALLEGRVEVVAVAAAWRAHGLVRVLDWQLRIVVEAMRINAMRAPEPAGDAMQSICGRLDLTRLDRVCEEILELRSALERQLNPGDQLALEGLAATWRDAARRPT